MKYVSFQLTMPNVGSWNGVDTGARETCFVVKKFGEKEFKRQRFLEKLAEGKFAFWHYNFGDGWGAQVEAEIVDAKEATRRKKISSGFRGYEWMIYSILSFGEILNERQRKERLMAEKQKEERREYQDLPF